MNHFVYYIGVGTNLGFRHDNILKAMFELQKHTSEKVGLSSIYASKPQGFRSRNEFLNAVMEFKSPKNPFKVLEILKVIEKKIHPLNQKRKPDNTYSDRYIDLDILHYNGPPIHSDVLVIPHPRLLERNFALVPLVDLNPNLKNPFNESPLINYIKNKNNLTKWKDKNQKLICIEGNIGAGKSTLIGNLHYKNVKKIFEIFNENPWLNKFYENSSKYALKTEMWFLKNRHQVWKNLFPSKHKVLIADYIYLKTKAFAEINLKKVEEFKCFTSYFEKTLFSIPQPDIILYIHVPLNVLRKNISERNRIYEKNIQTKYLKSIHNAYLNLFREYQHLNVLYVKSYEEALKELNKLLFLR